MLFIQLSIDRKIIQSEILGEMWTVKSQECQKEFVLLKRSVIQNICNDVALY